MEWSIEFDGTPQNITVTAKGRALPSDFGRVLEDVCLDERFAPGMLILLDLSDVEMDLVPQSEMVRFADELTEFRDRCEGCVLAIVSVQPLAASLVRAAGIAARADWLRVWVAPTFDEAATWLESQLALRG